MYRLLSLTLLSALFFACGGDSAPAGDGTTLAASTEAPASTHSSCLGDFDGDICDLMDYAVVAQFFPGEAEKKGYKSTERKTLSSCGFSMDDPTKTRLLETGTMKMTVPVNYSLSLLSLKQSEAENPLANFRSTYKTMTAAEIETSRANVEKGLKAQLDEGKIDQATYDNALKFRNVIGKAVYEEVPGLGTAAVWGGVPVKAAPDAGDLHVLDGDFSFSISADMGDKETSKKAAIALAKAVLARCE